MSILDVIANETDGIRQYSDQYQIRSNGSHTVHTVQERPFTSETCPPLGDQDNLMLDALYNYAEMHKGAAPMLRHFCNLAYDRFSPKEIYSYLIPIP